MVIWIVGMSASGKTTLAKEMYKLLRLRSKDWIYLDGDAVRMMFRENLGYTLEERRQNADRIMMLCHGLANNGYNVLVCLTSIFPENHRYNRSKLLDYREIYMKADLDTLVRRDNKGIYACALKGEMSNVVGVDIPFPEPEHPDIIIDNTEENVDFTALAGNCLEEFGVVLNDNYPYAEGNRLDYPIKYEYSPYEGPVFVKSYEKQRHGICHVLREHLKRLSPFVSFENDGMDDSEVFERFYGVYLPGVGQLLQNHKNETRYRPGLVSSQTLFWELLESYLAGGRTKEHAHVVDIYAKKFEVGKRFYRYYDENTFKKADDNYCDLTSYLIFANLLVCEINSQSSFPQKTILFNTLLKINDTIASVAIHLCTPEENVLSLAAMEGEQRIYGIFCAKGAKN